MTGNTVHLAEDMIHANWFGAATVGSVIAALEFPWSRRARFLMPSKFGETVIRRDRVGTQQLFRAS